MLKVMDRTKIFKKYQNKRIALTDNDKVISVGSTLEEVSRVAKKKGFDNPVTAKIPDLKLEFIL